MISNYYKWDKFIDTTVALSYAQDKYLEIDSNFKTKRNDKIINTSLLLNYRLDKNYSTSIGFSYNDANSNHIPFDFDKSTVKVGFAFNF